MYTAGIVQHIRRNFQQVTVVHDDQQVNFLKELLEEEVLFDSVYSIRKTQESFEDTMKKLVILSHFGSRRVRDSIEEGINPLPLMFDGQFRAESGVVAEAFAAYNEKYREMLATGLIKQIHRIPSLSSRGRNAFLPNERSLKILERPGKFVSGHLHQVQGSHFRNSIFLEQISRNIKSKLKQGVKQNEELLALKQLSEQRHSAFNIDMLKRLIVEANNQIKLMELPKGFDEQEKQVEMGKNQDALTIEEGPAKDSHTEAIELEEASIDELPIDIQGKTPEELDALGYKLIGKFDNPLNTSEYKTRKYRELKGFVEEISKSEKPTSGESNR